MAVTSKKLVHTVMVLCELSHYDWAMTYFHSLSG